MSTQSAAPQPRTRPAPSARNQQIYIDYQTTGRTQTELAADYKLTQCRISQILRRVARWLVGREDEAGREGEPPAEPSAASSSVPGSSLGPHNPEAPASASCLEPETQNPAHLERRLERERLHLICRQAMQHFHNVQKTITHKKGTRGDKPFDETTERIHPPNLQALKVVLQANRQIVGCVKRTEANVGYVKRTNVGWDAGPPSGAPPLDDPEFRDQVINWLAAGRDRAEKARLVSRDPDNHTVASELLKSFFGESTRNDIAVHILARDIGKELTTAPQGSYAHKWMSRKQSADPTKAATSGRGSQCTDDDDPQDIACSPSVPNCTTTENQPRETDDNPESVGCMSEAKCATDQPAPRTDEVPTALSTTSAIPPNPTQPQPSPQLPIQNPKSKIQNKPHQTTCNLKPGTCNSALTDNSFDRRLRHFEKLRQIREAQERGLPSMIYLDPQDGPIPRLEYFVNDPGWQPTIQSKEHQAQLVRDYMQKLHEQNNLKP